MSNMTPTIPLFLKLAPYGNPLNMKYIIYIGIATISKLAYSIISIASISIRKGNI